MQAHAAHQSGHVPRCRARAGVAGCVPRAGPRMCGRSSREQFHQVACDLVAEAPCLARLHALSHLRVSSQVNHGAGWFWWCKADKNITEYSWMQHSAKIKGS